MRSEEHRKRRIASALGEYRSELVLKNADIFNVFTGEMEHGDLAVNNGYVVGIGEYSGVTEQDASGKVIVPGFIDGHMHIESSIVTPLQYSKAVLPHGTCSIVADPHEIANVCGTDGIDFILQSTEKLPLDVYIMVPSCVPATPFDESGYKIGVEEVKHYLKHERVLGLAELMNYPGVFSRDTEVIEKIKATMHERKIIDGHGPGLSGKELNAYTTAGVFSDHECTSANEAIEKLKRGQWIMIREGTACKNLQALLPLCEEPYYHRCLFATDDKHPGDLAEEGHIDHIIRKAIKSGVKPSIAYQMATINAATYFHLPSVGAVCPGYRADFIILNDFNTVDIESVYKDGVKVAGVIEGKKWSIVWDDEVSKVGTKASICDTINISKVEARDFELSGPTKIIGLVPGEILTTDEGEANCIDVKKDILKLAVVERHHHTGHIGLSYIRGYGLKSGAIATSIAHDSHNIICVGTNDEDMATAVMALKDIKGGMVVVKEGQVVESLSLPIAGLMCDLSVEEAQFKMDAVKAAAHKLGVKDGIDPFMTLSFTSLAVVPSLRLTTLGVVDVGQFKLI